MVKKSFLGYKWVGGGWHINRDIVRSKEFLISAQLLNENQNVKPTLFGVFSDEKISEITVTTKGIKLHKANIYNVRVEDEKFYYIEFNENVSDYPYFIFTITYKAGEEIEYVLSDDDEISKL